VGQNTQLNVKTWGYTIRKDFSGLRLTEWQGGVGISASASAAEAGTRIHGFYSWLIRVRTNLISANGWLITCGKYPQPAVFPSKHRPSSARLPYKFIAMKLNKKTISVSRWKRAAGIPGCSRRSTGRPNLFQVCKGGCRLPAP